MRGRIRPAAIQIALIAMFLRALVPAGWMPEAGTHLLTICTMDGMQQIAVDQDGQPVKDKPAKDTPQLCPFAAAGHPVPATSVAALVAPNSPVFVSEDRDSIASPVSQRFLPQSLRGPPALS